MTISPTVLVEDNVRMDPSHPRAGGPQRRRAFSAADKLATPTESVRPGLEGGVTNEVVSSGDFLCLAPLSWWDSLRRSIFRGSVIFWAGGAAQR